MEDISFYLQCLKCSKWLEHFRTSGGRVSDDCVSTRLVNFLGWKQNWTVQIWLMGAVFTLFKVTDFICGQKPKLLRCRVGHFSSKTLIITIKMSPSFMGCFKTEGVGFRTGIQTEPVSENGQTEEQEKVTEQLWCLSAQVGRAAERQSFELLHHRPAASCWQ